MTGNLAFATAGRILLQLKHDRRSLGLMLVAPSVLAGLFAWLFMDVHWGGQAAFQHVGPVVLALFPFTVLFLVTSVTTLRERRTGTLERLLSTPIRKADVIFGYGLAFAVVAVLQAIITVSVTVWLLGLEVDGSVLLLMAVVATDALLGAALGLLASAFARTEFQAVQFMPIIVFPQMILGGVFMPRDEMPTVLAAISDFLPLSYALDAVLAVTRTETATELTVPLAVVAGCALGFMVLASFTLRRRTP